jgi:hypothetical protein
VFAVSIIRAMMEAASTSEASVNFYQTTRRNIPKDSNLHTRRREISFREVACEGVLHVLKEPSHTGLKMKAVCSSVTTSPRSFTPKKTKIDKEDFSVVIAMQQETSSYINSESTANPF